MDFLFPPLVFIISLIFILGIAAACSRLAAKPADVPGSAKRRPYGCGEDVSEEKVEPDYYGFFPFAIFFTLLHVAGLMIATWGLNPSMAGIGMISVYSVSVAVILMILFLDD